MEPTWKPHTPIPVEKTWNTFIQLVGGKLVSELVGNAPNFENADYLFDQEGVILELKEVETDFGVKTGTNNQVNRLFQRLTEEDPTWRPLLFGGDGEYPEWFHKEYLSILQQPVSRIIKKANRQIKSTKAHFGIDEAQGVLLFVNDGFISLSPDIIQKMSIDLLTRSYSSVDCFVYLTVNRYVDIPGSDIAHLIWTTAYGDNAKDSLVTFIDDLGKKWFNYLETLVGPFDDRQETPDRDVMKGSRSIKL